MRRFISFRFSVPAAAFLVPVVSRAEGSDPVTQLLSGLNLTGVASSLLSLGVTVLAICLSIKAISVSKQAINKI